MRSISFTNKKVRGVPRRLRALDRWSHGFEENFPAGLSAEQRYFNFKIPVPANLVEGRHATKAIRAECAQRLIDACHFLIQARPADAPACRVTCVICLPDMFTSEVCIYLDEDYFRSHTSAVSSENGTTSVIANRSLAREWNLNLPDGVNELGLAFDNRGHDDKDRGFVGECWYYGEVQ